MGSRWYTSNLNVITMRVFHTVVQWCESRRIEEIYFKVCAAMRWQLASRRRLLLIACQVLLKGPEKMVIGESHTAECTYDWLRRCDKEGMDRPPHSADYDKIIHSCFMFFYPKSCYVQYEREQQCDIFWTEETRNFFGGTCDVMEIRDWKITHRSFTYHEFEVPDGNRCHTFDSQEEPTTPMRFVGERETAIVR